MKSTIPPGLVSRGPLGMFQKLSRDPLGVMTSTLKYGDMCSFRVMNIPTFVLNHPDYVKHVLVDNASNYMKGRGLQSARALLGNGLLTSEREFHRRQRRLMQPAFHHQRIAHYADVVTRFTDRHIANWQSDQRLDLHHEMMTLTMRIVAKCLFDADVGSEADIVGNAITQLIEDFRPYDSTPLGQLWLKLPISRKRRMESNSVTLDEVVYRFIRERRASGEDHGDPSTGSGHALMSMLLQAQDVEGDGTGMTDEQVRDEVMTLFLAGHETTANAISWTCYLLSQYSEVEAKLREEVSRVLGGRTPAFHDLPYLKYVRMVMSESMRLYPPAWIVGRIALNDDEIGGYTIPKGATVVVCQYAMHRNPRYWDEPEAFKPDRFDPDVPHDRPRYAYFPFGGGARACIGEPFAWMEGQLIIAMLAQRFCFKLAPNAQIEPEPRITLRMKHGLPVIVERR